MNDWFTLGITMGTIVVSVALAWGNLKTKIAERMGEMEKKTVERTGEMEKKIAVIEQRLHEFETNHFPHIKESIHEMKKINDHTKEIVIRIEEHLKRPQYPINVSPN